MNLFALIICSLFLNIACSGLFVSSEETNASSSSLSSKSLEKEGPQLSSTNKPQPPIPRELPPKRVNSNGNQKDLSYLTDEDELPNKEDLSNQDETNSFENFKASYFTWPVDDARLTRGYIPHKTGKRKRPHYGLDLAGSKGTPIFAAHNGVVVYSGSGFKHYGKMVLVEGDNGWATLYAHLSKILAKEGDEVKQGDTLGQMGRTGRASGVHLHFEVRYKRGPVDPLLYLPNGQLIANQIQEMKKATKKKN